MKKQILLSLILALLFFTPSYAEDSIPNELKKLHNIPDEKDLDEQAKQDLKQIISELEVEKSAISTNAEEIDPNTPTTDGLEDSK